LISYFIGQIRVGVSSRRRWGWGRGRLTWNHGHFVVDVVVGGGGVDVVETTSVKEGVVAMLVAGIGGGVE